MSILQTKTYKVNEEKKVPIIKNWTGRKEQLIQTFNNFEKAKQQKVCLLCYAKNSNCSTMKPHCPCNILS